MSESNHEVRSLAAVMDTWSSRSMWDDESGTGTTYASMPNAADSDRPRPGARVLAGRRVISTRPVSRARLMSRDTVDREVPRCRAMTSIFRSWR